MPPAVLTAVASKRGVLVLEQGAVDGVRISDRISDRGYVIEHGRVTRQRAGDDLSHDDKVRAAYLGLQPGSARLAMSGLPPMVVTGALRGGTSSVVRISAFWVS